MTDKMENTSQQEFFMRIAIQVSEEKMLSGKGGPFGAIVVKNGRIIAKGWNEVTSRNDPTAHAEVQAIRKACKKLGSFDLSGCELYTSTEPCPMCLGAIYWARPTRVYYGNTRKDAAAIGFDDDFIYREIPLPAVKRKIPFVNLLRQEALVAFRRWETKKDKIRY